jgi:hypothetical protein
VAGVARPRGVGSAGGGAPQSAPPIAASQSDRKSDGDGVARGTGIFRPHVADDLEVPRHVVQHLGDVFAELGHLAAAAEAGAGTVVGRLMHDLAARQMIGQRLAFRPRALRRWRLWRWLRGFSAGGILGLATLQFFQPQFELLNLPADPLR